MLKTSESFYKYKVEERRRNVVTSKFSRKKVYGKSRQIGNNESTLPVAGRRLYFSPETPKFPLISIIYIITLKNSTTQIFVNTLHWPIGDDHENTHNNASFISEPCTCNWQLVVAN